MPRRPPLWRYTTGIKGVSRVTVYERSNRPCLYVDYFEESGRIQRTIERHTGTPLPNTEQGRGLAVRFAERLTQEREQLMYRRTARTLGVVAPSTLPELLKRLHVDKSERWSETHSRDQKRFRAFWTAKLGPVMLQQVSASLVERVAADEAKRRKWAPRTHGSYLRYIVDAFYYAERKLKWIDARDNLSAVDIPSPRSRGISYSLEEIADLLPTLDQVAPEAAWIGHVAWQTGRRLSAIRQLRKRDVLTTDGRAVLRFGRSTDKVGAEGEAVVVGRAAELTDDLMRSTGKYVLGSEPPSLDVCEDWLVAGEKLAKIDHVKGRAWHGLKRRWASETQGQQNRQGQAGTQEGTLRRVYEQDDLEPKARLASALAQAVEKC